MKVMMKVKNLLFITIFLAAASLGLSLPPESPILPSNTTSVSPQVDQVLNAVPANVLGDLSQKCQNTLLTIVTSPEFLKCIPLTSLLALLPLATDPSLISNFIANPAKNYPPVEKPLIQFATLFCPAPKCSDKGVSDTIKLIQDGCKDDIDKGNKFIEFILDITVFYSPLHDNICFKFGKTFCWDETILTTIHLPPSPFTISGDKIIDAVAVADPSAVCTKCNKAIVNTFLNFIDKNELARRVLAELGVDDLALKVVKTAIAIKCGAKFEDGKIPK